MNVSGEMHRIELVLVDDVSDEGRAKANADYLVTGLGIKLLLGPVSSPLTHEVAAISHTNNATLVGSRLRFGVCLAQRLSEYSRREEAEPVHAKCFAA